MLGFHARSRLVANFGRIDLTLPLARYREHGQLAAFDTREAAPSALLARWAEDGQAAAPQGSLIGDRETTAATQIQRPAGRRQSISVATAQLEQQMVGLIGLQVAHVDVREATAWPHERLIEVADARQVRREEDLSTLRLSDAIGYVEEAMQRLIPVGARRDQMVGVLDQEGVMLARDELDEDFVTLSNPSIAGVERHRMLVLHGVLAQ